MAIDTATKRYSALNVNSPWRGSNLVPNAAFPQGSRQAAAYLYSGILAGGYTSSPSNEPSSMGMIPQVSAIASCMNTSMGQG